MPYVRIGSNDTTGEIDYEALERSARRIVHDQNGGVCMTVGAKSVALRHN